LGDFANFLGEPLGDFANFIGELLGDFPYSQSDKGLKG
jgi:hypothetical protein